MSIGSSTRIKVAAKTNISVSTAVGGREDMSTMDVRNEVHITPHSFHYITTDTANMNSVESTHAPSTDIDEQKIDYGNSTDWPVGENGDVSMVHCMSVMRNRRMLSNENQSLSPATGPLVPYSLLPAPSKAAKVPRHENYNYMAWPIGSTRWQSAPPPTYYGFPSSPHPSSTPITRKEVHKDVLKKAAIRSSLPSNASQTSYDWLRSNS